MKKRIAVLLTGGLVAVGSLSMQMPITAQAVTYEECGGATMSHLNSYEVTTVDGELTVIIDIKDFEADITDDEVCFALYALEKEMKSPAELSHLSDALDEAGWPEEACLFGRKESGTYTFKDLPADKLYFVYCTLADHGVGEGVYSHDVENLGCAYVTAGPASTPSENKPVEENKPAEENKPSVNTPSTAAPTDYYKEAEKAIADQIKLAEPGSIVTLDEGITTLSNATMKELLKKGDVSLKLAFTYNEKDYVIIIPAGAALDNDIPWYGPLYLAQQYGNSAETVTPQTTGESTIYTVKSGDTLSKLAAANNMTLKQLLTKNPQIKDANKIAVGQKINL